MLENDTLLDGTYLFDLYMGVAPPPPPPPGMEGLVSLGSCQEARQLSSPPKD